ncbi:hypothetical protein Leryth_020712 [Lithospermum erythrorhizon]|nr:hypothetical protein Leryth_020712 [Lithospermum erythrorhizon]
MGGGVIITRVLEDVLPCISMLLVEACTIFLTIAASTAMARGMSPFVFVVYTNALASIILLPYSFISDRDKIQRPLFTSHLLWRVFLLGLIGVTIAQNLAFLGLFYSSPIVAISMANIVPALSFMLTAMLK